MKDWHYSVILILLALLLTSSLYTIHLLISQKLNQKDIIKDAMNEVLSDYEWTEK